MSAGERDTAGQMTFAGHLEALRPHLVRGGAVFSVLVVAAFLCKEFLVDGVLFGPMRPEFPTNRLLEMLAAWSGIDDIAIGGQNFELVSTTMAGQFNLHLRISVITALAAAFPYILWEMWRFVRPALTERELQGCRNFVFYVSVGFFVGLLFGYFVIAPLTVGFLAGYNVSELVVNRIDVNSYLSTVMNVSIACALVFQLPLLVRLLTRMGLVTPDFLRRYRRHAIIVLAVLAAVITPPDAVSMVMVLLPLWALYEYSIHLSAKTLKKQDS